MEMGPQLHKQLEIVRLHSYAHEFVKCPTNPAVLGLLALLTEDRHRRLTLHARQ